MNAADALAVSMLAVIFIALGMVGLLVFQMSRGNPRRNADVECLIEEALAEDDAPLHEDFPDAATAGGSKEPEPWERGADWWKDPSK
jgi:hypothetical protein